MSMNATVLKIQVFKKILSKLSECLIQVQMCFFSIFPLYTSWLLLVLLPHLTHFGNDSPYSDYMRAMHRTMVKQTYRKALEKWCN